MYETPAPLNAPRAGPVCRVLAEPFGRAHLPAACLCSARPALPQFCEICKHAVHFIEANHVPIYNSHGADYFMVGAKSMCKALGEETDTEFVECLGLTKGLRSNPALVNGIAIGCTNKEGTSFGPFECPPSHLCNHLSALTLRRCAQALWPNPSCAALSASPRTHFQGAELV